MASWCEFIAERSEGIPLFVEELLGAVRDGRVEQDFLPPSLRDVVLARAELLSRTGSTSCGSSRRRRAGCPTACWPPWPGSRRQI